MATRLEKVKLDIDSNLAPVMIRDAQAAALLKRELNSLSGSAVRGASKNLDGIGTSANKSGRELDRFSGRLRLVGDAIAILGPAAIPIAAIAIPAVTGLAAQLGAAALAGGTAIIAFQGVGDTLTAVNKAALEPTTANLEAAQVAMERLGPEARAFVTELQSMIPALQSVRNAAAAGLFPGLTESLGELEAVLPQVEAIVFRIGDALGDLAAGGAESLTGPRWAEFLSFVETEVPSALTTLGHTIGNLTHGLAEMWMAFTPLNNDFAGWMLDASRSFDAWAEGLSQTEGFREFVEYVRTSGPQVADAMGSIGNALLQIVQAAAPLGGPVLAALTAVADALAAIAGSPAGPAIMSAVTALALLNRGMAVTKWSQGTALFAGLGTAADGTAKKMNTMQRATVGLAGALAAFAAIEVLQGGLTDFSIGVETMTASLLDLEAVGGALPANLADIENSIRRLADPGMGEALQDNMSAILGGAGNEDEFYRAEAQIKALDAALTGLVQRGQADTAADLLGNLGLSKSTLSDLMGLLPGYKDALAGADNQTRLAAGGFEQAASAAQQFRAAVEEINETLSRRASFRDYEASLDDFRESLNGVKDAARLLNKNGKINIDLPKGREIAEKLDNIASTAVKVAESLKGADRVQFLKRARQDFVEVAALLLGDKEAARQLANELLDLGKLNPKPKIDVDTGRAKAGIDFIRNALRLIPDETVRVNVVRHGTGSGFGAVDGFAAGGFVCHARPTRIPSHLKEN